MPDAEPEVFRSTFRSECAERAFVLSALGISSVIRFEGAYYVLAVDAADYPAAQEQLRSYDAESKLAAPAAIPSDSPQHPFAWVGCLCYIAVLIGIDLAIANGWWRLDAFDLGVLDAGLVRSGQWWRAWTALTLHLDGAHLSANLVVGTWFGYLAARQIGSGSAWFMIVSGAALANLLESGFGPATHRAVGASTAVFTALGLLVAHAWRMRLHLAQGWARRWAPLVAGAVLLGWFGAGGGGEGAAADVSVDVVAHALGFACGCLLGAAAALPALRQPLARVPQWLAGIAALASLGIAWACALLRP